MGMFDDVEGIVKRQMVLFFVVDTSGSMQGTKIGAVNEAIEEVLPVLPEVGGSDVDLKVACLTFSSGCQWIYPTPLAAESFKWNRLQADGVTDLGEACRELSEKMSRHEFLSAPSASVAPVIFLMSDGEPTDDFESGLNKLKQNRWFKYAIKVAVAIGDDANKETLAKFTGNVEAVITVHTPEALKKWIRKVTITTTKIGSNSTTNTSTGEPESKQDAVVDEIKEIKQTEPDLDNENDWEW